MDFNNINIILRVNVRHESTLNRHKYQIKNLFRCDFQK